MEPPPSPTTIIPFSQRHRWRWWALVIIGGLLVLYGLALLTSPAWARFGIFGYNDFWLWVRGELYLVFGFLQLTIGIGHIRLTSRPADAIVADAEGIVVRRLYSSQHLAWDDVTHVREGRTSVLVASIPITFWRLITYHPEILRLDSTIMDVSAADLKAMVAMYRRA